RDLELARQIGRPVERFLVGARLGARRIVEKDLAISGRARQQVLAETLREGADLGVRLRPWRGRGADHVGIVVAAGRDRIEAGSAQAAQMAAQVAFTDAVELERLPRREPQRSVGELSRERIEREPLRRGADAAWQ